MEVSRLAKTLGFGNRGIQTTINFLREALRDAFG